MQGEKILKITSVFLLIGGVIAVFAGVIVPLGIKALLALEGKGHEADWIYAAAMFVIAAAIVQIIAGVKGLGACSRPEKAASCIGWGIFVTGVNIGSMLVVFANEGSFSIGSLVPQVVLPGLYTYGAVRVRDNTDV